MAAIPTAIRALMKSTVTLKVCTTSDAYGAKTLGAANTVRVRIDYNTVRVLSQSGETVDSTTQVYCEDVTGFTPEGEITLPDGSKPKIIGVRRLSWPNGATHLEIAL